MRHVLALSQRGAAEVRDGEDSKREAREGCAIVDAGDGTSGLSAGKGRDQARCHNARHGMSWRERCNSSLRMHVCVRRNIQSRREQSGSLQVLKSLVGKKGRVAAKRVAVAGAPKPEEKAKVPSP